MKNLLRILVCFAATAMMQAAQSPTPGPAAPVEPVGAIVQAFRTHPVVAIGNVEFRGDEQCHRFRLALLRDPRFAAIVNDILVEFGDAQYQDVIDRFVGGEDVAYKSLRRVWQDTTQVEYEWDRPIYEDFFRAVRAVNASLPPGRRLRVLLGDPPIDWGRIHNLSDLLKAMGDRDAYAVDVLRREVLAKGRRALVIYGGQHLTRKNTHGIVARIEKDHLARVLTVLPETRRDLRAIEPDVAAWPSPSLAMLRGTTLGSTLWDPDPQRRPVRLEEQFDAVLYLGPPSAMTISKLAPALCSDRAYIEMRLSRLGLVPPPPGAAFNPADQLKDDCAHPEGRAEIPDREPAITELIRQTLRDAARGKVSPDAIAPESRERLISFLQRAGPQYLGSAGELQSLVLLADTESGGKHIRRYRTVFDSGLAILWTVGLSSAGTIVSLDPQPE